MNANEITRAIAVGYGDVIRTSGGRHVTVERTVVMDDEMTVAIVWTYGEERGTYFLPDDFPIEIVTRFN
jgi:hypothetical protein